MKRAALYIRVSTLEQAQEGYSVGEQKERLIAYCKAKDWLIAVGISFSLLCQFPCPFPLSDVLSSFSVSRPAGIFRYTSSFKWNPLLIITSSIFSR